MHASANKRQFISILNAVEHFSINFMLLLILLRTFAERNAWYGENAKS